MKLQKACYPRWHHHHHSLHSYLLVIILVVVIACPETGLAFRPGYRGAPRRAPPPPSNRAGSRTRPSSTNNNAAAAAAASPVVVSKNTNVAANPSPVNKGTNSDSTNSGSAGVVSKPKNPAPEVASAARKGPVPSISYKQNSILTGTSSVQKLLPLYKPRDPPPYATYAQQSYAQRPFPPSYDSIYGPPAPNKVPAVYGKLTPKATVPRIASMPPAAPRRTISWLQNAIFFGLGRFFSHSGLPNYRLYGTNGSNHLSNDDGNSTRDAIPIVNASEGHLYNYVQLSPKEVEQLRRNSINTRPLWLNDSLTNLPFYGWNYTTWESNYTTWRPLGYTDGFTGYLSNVLLGLLNYYSVKDPLILDALRVNGTESSTNQTNIN